MPVDALAEPWDDSNRPVRVQFRRVWLDVLDRPMDGRVRLTGKQTVVEGHRVLPPAPVELPLVGGVLDVRLPPGDYSLIAQLVTVDGANVVDRDDFTLTA